MPNIKQNIFGYWGECVFYVLECSFLDFRIHYSLNLLIPLSCRNLVKSPGKREFTIFNLLAKYVKEPSRAKAFVDILLPLLTKRHQNSG